jgi:3-hydroxyisobutyrate dehydrogenase
VVNTEQIEAVTFGSDGLAEALPAGAVLVMSATVPPAYVEDLARRLAGRGVLVLDAPVSGGPARAAAGELSVMAAGPAEAFARCEAMLKAVAGRLFRVGDRPGAGSKVKIVNNLLAGINLAAGAEALAFGLKLGLDPRLLYDVVTASSGQSWIFADRMARALAGDYAPRAATRVLTKDLSIGLAAAAVAGCPLPLAAAAHRVYEAALAHGLGEEDDAALLKFAAAAAGVDPPA